MPRTSSGHHTVSIDSEAKDRLDSHRARLWAELGFVPTLSQVIKHMHKQIEQSRSEEDDNGTP